MPFNINQNLDPWDQRRQMFLKGDVAPIQQKTLTDKENNFADYGFNYTLGADNEELRAQNQSTGEKYLHGLGKAVVLAGTTFADGIIGTIVGAANLAGQSIAEGEFKGSAYWNNDFTNTMKEWQDWGEQALPNYYSKSEQEAPWYSQALGLSDGTANFWADKVLKNLGFAIGAGAAAIVTGSAINSLQGTKSIMSRVAKGLATATKDEQLAASVAYNGGEAIGELAKDSKLLARNNFRSQVAGNILGAQAESRFEALNASKEFIDNQVNRLIQKGYSKDQAEALVAQDKQIQSDALGVGNGTFALNMALLSATGYSEFSDAITKGFNPSKILTNNIAVDLEKGLVSQAGKLGTKATNAVKMGKNFFMEGVVEEMGQSVVSGTQKDYYNRKYDDDATAKTNSYLDSFIKNVAETYGTAKGWEEGFIGGFSGMVGIPGMPGNIVSQIKETREENRQTTEAVNKLKEIMQKPEFKNRYNSIIRGESINNDKQIALSNNDLFEFNNADHEAFMNDVNSFIDAGKFNEFIEYLGAAQNLTLDESKKLFNKTVTNEDGTTSEVNPFANEDEESLKKRISKNYNILKQKAEKIKEVRENIETKFNTLDRNSILTMTHMASTIEDVDTRINQIKTKLAVKAPELTGIVEGLFNVEATDAEGKALNDDRFIEALDQKMKEDPGKYDLYNDAKDLLKLIQRKKDFGEAYLKAVKDPKAFQVYNKAKERDAELANKAGGAKNKYIYDKYTNTDSKFGFDSSEFDVETNEIIPDNIYDITYTDRKTGETKSARAVKTPDKVSPNGITFLNYTDSEGNKINIPAKNLLTENLVTSKKVTKKVKFEEGAPHKLVDEQGKEYNTSEFADQIIQNPNNIKHYSEIRNALILESRIKTLGTVVETLNKRKQLILDEIVINEQKCKENFDFLTKALNNKTGKTTVTIDGKKIKKTVQDLSDAYNSHTTKIQELEQELTNLDKEYEELLLQNNKPTSVILSEYSNLEEDQKTLKTKIENLYQTIEESKQRLSTLEKLINKLRALVKGALTALGKLSPTYWDDLSTRMFITDRIDNLELKINLNTTEAQELRDFIALKEKEVKVLENQLIKFTKENEQWESELLELIKTKNKETVAEVATQKTSVINDAFEEVQNLEENKEAVLETTGAKKSFNSLASTTGVHDNNPDTFNTLPKLDLERQHVSLKVITKETAPELFTQPEELNPSNPAIKVIIYVNGTPVNKDLEPISETDYDNMLTLHLSESKLESDNPDYKEKFYDLQDFEPEELEAKIEEYNQWRNNVIEEVNNSKTPKFIYPKSKSNGVMEFDWNQKRTKDFDNTSSIWDSLFSIFGDNDKAKAENFASATISIPSINTLNGKNVVPGLPYLIFNNSVIPLITRKLNSSDIDVIIDLLKLKELNQKSVYTKTEQGQGKGKWVKSKVKGGKELDGTVDKNGNILKWQEGKAKQKVNTRRQGKKQFFKYKKTGRKLGEGLYYLKTDEFSGEQINIFSYLQTVLYMGDHLPEKRNIQTEFFYDAKTKEVVFYNFKEGKQVRIPCTAKSLEDNREALTEFLGSKYHQISKKELDKNAPYYHITKVNGSIVEYEKYSSYKAYLLSNKKQSTERNTNDIPLTTNFKTKENPIKSQYFTFDVDPLETNLKDIPNQVKSKKAAPVKFTPTSKPATTSNNSIDEIKNKVKAKVIKPEILAITLLSNHYKNIDKDSLETVTDIFLNTGDPNADITPELIEEAIDKVVAYYESANTTVVVPNAPVTPNTTLFRLAKTTKFANGNFEAAKKWLLERFSNIDVEQVKGLIEGKAFGQALYNAVKLAETFEEGTEYHEAFHITTMMYLSDSELTDLYKEANKLYGKPTVKDLKDLKKIYPNMTNDQLVEAFYEEKLAEDFKNYVLTKQKIAPKGLKGIFQKLWNKIKQMLGLVNHPKIAELYDKIESGYFKDSPSVYNRLNKYKLNSNLPGITVHEKNMLVEGLLSNVLRKYLAKKSIRTLGDPYNGLDTILYEEKNNLLSILKSNNNNQHIVDLVQNNYADVVKEVLNYLKQFGSKVTYDEAIEEIGEENRPSKDIFSDAGAVKISNEESASTEIKLLVGTLPVVENNAIALNELGLLRMSEFGSTFNYLSSLLNGLTTYDDMIEKINSVKELKPELKALLLRLENKSGDSLDDFLLRQKFTQTFAKTKLEYQQWLIDNDGKVYFTNSTGDSQENRILENWKASINNMINERGAPVKLENGIPVFNITRINENLIIANKIKNLEEKVTAKLKTLGINITLVKNISTKDLNKLNENIEYLIKYGITKNTKVEEFFKESVSRLRTIANFDAAINDGDVSLQHIGPDGETRYSITLNNYLTLIGDTFKNLPEINARQKFFELHPYLDNVNTQNSYFLKPDGLLFKANGDKKADHKLVMTVIEGARPDDSSAKGEAIADMKAVDKLWLSINNILTGNIPFLRASDKSLEFGFNLGKPLFEISSINDGAIREKYMSIFKGYIKDEINRSRLLRKGVGANIKYYNKHGLDLYMFKNILNIDTTKVLNDKNDGIVDSWMKANDGYIENQLDIWISSLSKRYLDKLIDNKVLERTRNGFKNKGISTNLKGVQENISNEFMDDILKTFTVSSLIANIEHTKLFTGDPAMYKNMADFYKRTSAPVGTKLLAFDDEDINNYLNTDHRRRDKKTSNGLVKCVTSSDVTSISQYIDSYSKKLKQLGKTEDQIKAILKPYQEMTENDAQGLITLCEYKEFLLRTGTYWTHKHEDIYQRAIRGMELEASELAYFQPLKAQHFGPKAQDSYGANSIATMTFLKFSLMPLIPSVIKGTNLEKLYVEMTKKQVGIHIADSGTKLGAQLETDDAGNFVQRPFYKKDGSINNVINDESTYDLYYKFLGIQVEIAPEVKDKGIYGTQERKLILSNTFNQAKANVMSFFTSKGQEKTTIEELQKEYNTLITNYTKNKFNKLLKDLEAVKNPNGTYTLTKLDKVIQILKSSAEDRNAPDNLIQSIASINVKDLQSFRSPLDVLPNRNKIENILLALVNNDVIRQKVKGGGKIQGSSTGFENTSREFTKGDIVKSTGLKFYREGAYGETLPAQFKIALPKDLIEYANKLGGLNKLNELLAYAFSEVEENGKINIEKSPRYNSKLVDNWLTTRGIQDKFNPKVFQFIGYRIPTQGLNSIENGEIIEFLPPEAAELIVVPSEIVAKSGSDFDIDKLNVFLHEYKKDENLNLISSTDEQKKIFNRLIEINQLILSSPENFEELITPNDDTIIKNIANGIKTTKKLNTDKPANSLIEWDYIQDIGKYFLVGKAGVGQMALHNTHHVLSQQVGAKVNPTFKNVNNEEKSTKLFFEKVNNEYSISSIYDIDNKNKITDIISQLLNGFVDVAKEPYVFFLNANTSTNDTITYLLRRRVPIDTIANFMTQPILDDYLKAQNINESMMSVIQGEDVGKPKLVNTVRKKYTDKIDSLSKFDESKLNLLLNKTDLTQGLSFSLDNLPKDKTQAIQWLYLQVQVLDNFINYQDQATVLNDIMSISKADTTTPKNLNNLLTKKILKRRIANSNLFTPELINKYLTDTMLTGFQYAQTETEDLFNDLFLTESSPVKNKLLALLSLYINTRKSQDDIADVLDLFKNDFITFLYSTTKTIEKNKKTTNLSSLIPELFFDKDFSGNLNADVANTLSSYKNSPAYKKNVFFKAIVPLINDLKRTQNNIKFFNKKMTRYQSDLLTESYRELLDKNPNNSLAAKLQYVFMLQGGLQNSPISFVDKIPHEYYSSIVTKAVAAFKDNPSLIDAFIDQLYRNNYSNSTLVPKAAKKYYEEENNTFVYPNDNSISEYPYLKKWIKETDKDKIKQGFSKGYWALYKGSKGDIETTFSEVSKLGDGFYLKEYYPTLRPSVIAKNNIAEDKFESTKLINKFETLKESINTTKEISNTNEEITTTKLTTAQLKESTLNSLKETFDMDPKFFEKEGIKTKDQLDKLSHNKLKELIKKYC